MKAVVVIVVAKVRNMSVSRFERTSQTEIRPWDAAACSADYTGREEKRPEEML